MNIDLTWQTTCIGSVATVQLGTKLGANLRGSEVIELIGDVGGGKTTLVRGIAEGAGSKDTVASPSFTIARQYTAISKTIYHLDFYRLQDPGVMADELDEYLGDPHAVVIVEWADIVEDILPPERLQVRITATSENQRELLFSFPSSLDYLIPRSV